MQRESVARFIFFFCFVRNPTFSPLLDACDGEKIKDIKTLKWRLF